MAAIIPSIQGSIIGIAIQKSISYKLSKAFKSPTLPLSMSAEKGIGNNSAANTTNETNFFLFNFINSHFINLSNSLASRHTLEIIFKAFLTGMRF